MDISTHRYSFDTSVYFHYYISTHRYSFDTSVYFRFVFSEHVLDFHVLFSSCLVLSLPLSLCLVDSNQWPTNKSLDGPHENVWLGHPFRLQCNATEEAWTGISCVSSLSSLTVQTLRGFILQAAAYQGPLHGQVTWADGQWHHGCLLLQCEVKSGERETPQHKEYLMTLLGNSKMGELKTSWVDLFRRYF